ncbi:nucleoside-diphosphate sugar epimerase/dehydratase [Clostridium sp. YIM B02551]|uniref:polysaccharide biosynthesis protein n=1 Tax=Clostridium sp. YIM B02551 TaxID=2910679 RepID=UPI001EEA2D84|nr:nucleoside-diphosphate sugar epimerase/dehydratase [Clostridium sp. YIM B02551]
MKNFKRLLVICIDLFLVNLAYLLAIDLTFYDSFTEITTIYKQDALAINCIFIVFFTLFKLYDSLWDLTGTDEFLMAVGGSVLAGLFSILYTRFLGNTIPLNVSVIGVVFAICFVLGYRILYRVYRRYMIYAPFKYASGQKRVMIVGAGSAGAMIINEILSRRELKYNPTVIVDDDKSKIGKRISGVTVEGDREDIPRLVKEKEIDLIIIAIPSIDEKNKMEIINLCKNTGCKIQIIPGIYEILKGDATISKIKDVDVEDLLGRDPINLDNKGISDYITNKTVIVTGGGGSIGSELCRQIATFKPKMLIIFDIYENNAYDIQNELKYNYPKLNLKVLIGSVRDSERIEEIFSLYRPDVVFHAAAHKHVPLMEDSPKEAIKNNVLGTYNVALAADKYNASRFVLISTDKAVNPTNIMGATKRLCEMVVQAMDKKSDTEFVAVRFGNVLGSNGSVIPLFKKQISQGGPITVTHKNITRFFMLIPEAAQLVLQAGAFAKGGEIFVLDMGKPVKIYDLACDLIRLSGLEPNRDIKIKVTGLRPGEKLYEELLMSEEGLTNTSHNKIYIGKPSSIEINELETKLEELRRILLEDNHDMIKEKMKQIVPTYQEMLENETAADSEN